jgi:hypothetical protein
MTAGSRIRKPEDNGPYEYHRGETDDKKPLGR